jgi:hypothetical protein
MGFQAFTGYEILADFFVEFLRRALQPVSMNSVSLPAC